MEGERTCGNAPVQPFGEMSFMNRSAALTRDEVLGLLQRLTQPDLGSLSRAEEDANLAMQLEGFGPRLFEVMLDDSVYLGFRQLAGILAKRWALRHWEPDFAAADGSVRVSDGDKQVVRGAALHVMADKHSRLRTAAAMFVAKVAEFDWPERWPELLPLLLRGLESGSPEFVHGSIKCLSMWAEQVSDTQLPQVIPALFPALLRVFEPGGAFTVRVQMRALWTAGWLFRMLGLVHSSYKAEALALLLPMLPNWFSVFSRSLHPPNGAQSDCGLQMQAVQCLSIFARFFPKIFRKYAADVLPKVWMVLMQSCEIYERSFVRESEQLMHGAVDSDGDSLGIGFLIGEIFDFLQTMCESRKLSGLLEDGVGELMKVVLRVMQLTEEQLETWEDDVTQFAADEFDSAEIACDVRVSAQFLIEEVATNERFGDAAAVALIQCASDAFAESEMRRQSGDRSWWKMLESAILALGCAAEVVVTSPGFDVEAFTQSVLLNQATKSDVVYLKGRALWCCGKLANSLPSPLASRCLSEAVVALGPGNAAPLRLCACCALSSLCRSVPVEVAAPAMDHVLRGLSLLLSQMDDEALTVVLDSLELLLKINPDAALANVAMLSRDLRSVWIKFHGDALIAVDVVNDLTILARLPGCARAVTQTVFPTILEALRAGLTTDRVTGIQEHAVDLLASLVAVPFDDSLMDAFPLVVAHALHSDDHDILHACSICLGEFVGVGGNVLNEWRNENGTGIQQVVQIVERMLDPSVDEGAALYVGKLVYKLVSKVPFCLGDVLPGMLRACVGRLICATRPPLIQALILVFAQLMRSHFSEVLALIDGVALPDGSRGLERVLRIWVKEHRDLVAPFDIKLSLHALAMQFVSGDARLKGIIVDGDAVFDNAGRAVTRSMTARARGERFTQIPLPLKIFRLLISELVVEEEADWEDYSSESDGGDEEDLQDALNMERPAGGAKRREGACGRDVFFPAEAFEGLDGLGTADTLRSLGVNLSTIDAVVDETDPSVIADPLFAPSPKDVALEFFAEFWKQNLRAFEHYVGQLSVDERETLEGAMRAAGGRAPT